MNQVRTSTFLALVLRHRPETIGVVLDNGGWVEIEDLRAAMAAHGHRISRHELEAVVAESDKQRFVIDRATDRIRANQGHSVDVNLGLPDSVPPDVLYHGTPIRNVESTLADGLLKKGRHAVHLSSDVHTAHRVGLRRGAAVVLAVNAAAMHADGHRFSVSANGVWLTESVAPQYLRRNRHRPERCHLLIPVPDETSTPR